MLPSGTSGRAALPQCPKKKNSSSDPAVTARLLVTQQQLEATSSSCSLQQPVRNLQWGHHHDLKTKSSFWFIYSRFHGQRIPHTELLVLDRGQQDREPPDRTGRGVFARAVPGHAGNGHICALSRNHPTARKTSGLGFCTANPRNDQCERD